MLRFSGRNVVPSYRHLLRPAQDGGAGPLGAVVADHHQRLAVSRNQRQQFMGDVRATSAKHSRLFLSTSVLLLEVAPEIRTG